MTISINGGTAHDLTWQNIGAFSGGEIQDNGIYEAVFDGAQWQLQSPSLQPPQQLTTSEISIGLTNADIVDWSYPQCFVDRYGKNTIPGTTDMTAAAQTAIEVGKALRIPVEFLAAKYKVTDTLLCYTGTIITGKTLNQYTAIGAPGGTTIIFSPASLKTLFEFQQTGVSFVNHISISGIYAEGDGGTNCLYGIDCDWAIYGNFFNLCIDGFKHGVRLFHTINNRFENIFLRGSISAVLYAGGSCTTDVWEQCTFFGSPTGCDIQGSNIGIRFSNCLWEQCNNYGINIYKECQSIQVFNGYCEDVPFTANANGCMFRVCYDGTTPVVENALTIMGGIYQGRNAGTIGNWLDCDDSDSVMLDKVNVSRYTSAIRATSNARSRSIVMGGFAGISFTNVFADATSKSKCVGLYPITPISTVGYTQSFLCGSVDSSADITSGGLLVSNFSVCVKDSISVPSTFPGYAQIFVDSADGALKVKFGDGDVVLIANNPP